VGNFKSKGKKDPFAELDNEYKDSIASSSPEDINKKIAEVAKNQEENLRLMGEDQDLAEKKEAVKEASAQYREASKMNKLRITYAIRVLGDKGQQ
jgi:predicted carbohydrate-binding protein with CBM5 and CBM33 domain